jgi:hypothetical protein
MSAFDPKRTLATYLEARITWAALVEWYGKAKLYCPAYLPPELFGEKIQDAANLPSDEG